MQYSTESTYEPEHLRTQEFPPHELHPVEDLTEYLREYSRERPEAVALFCLGLGFVLGWKLKPW